MKTQLFHLLIIISAFTNLAYTDYYNSPASTANPPQIIEQDSKVPDDSVYGKAQPIEQPQGKIITPTPPPTPSQPLKKLNQRSE